MAMTTNEDGSVSIVTGGTLPYRLLFRPYCTMDKRPEYLYMTFFTRRDESPPRPDSPRLLCWACDQPGILQCATCKTGRYCSVACQAADASLHKEYCRVDAFDYPIRLQMDHY